MSDLIIAIDGYSGTGKSSTAKSVAKALDYTYIDSGAMYRAVTFYFIMNEVDINDMDDVLSAIQEISIDLEGEQVLLNGKNVSDKIRTMEVNNRVSEVSKIKPVRDTLVRRQREIGSSGRVVMDGRDIGTVVFPDADLKVFMTASVDVRAKRRLKELSEKKIDTELDTVKKNLLKRDKIDSTRTESPLKKAADAVEIDTSNLTFDDQVSKIVNLAKQKAHAS